MASQGGQDEMTDLVNLVKAIDDKEAQVALIRARARASNTTFPVLMLQLVSIPGEHAKADDEKLLEAVNDWPTESKEDAKHDLLIKDLVALVTDSEVKGKATDVNAAEKENLRRQLKSSAIKILAGYARVYSIPISLLLQELLEAKRIEVGEDALCAAISLQTKEVMREVREWDAEAEPTFVRLRDKRGHHMKMVFLGNVQDHADESSPNSVLIQHWGLSKPSTAITLDAGTIHPKHCDSEHDTSVDDGLSGLPKFEQFLAEAGETEEQRKTRQDLQSRSSVRESSRAAVAPAATAATGRHDRILPYVHPASSQVQGQVQVQVRMEKAMVLQAA